MFESILEVELYIAVRAGKCELSKIISNSFVNHPGLKLFFTAGTLVKLVLIQGIDTPFAHVNSTKITTCRSPHAILANTTYKIFFELRKAIFRLEANG